ncbi:unnamed protein product [Urochloa decumbens]|uniref:No apical meristem-associated C-terminal domain-containing protein n=1 Tax=Urochloa decumbens TaxID=240449 RepID=A0ABC8YHM0_9POAL
MAGSEPDHAAAALGRGAAAPGRDGPSRTMPLLAGAPRGISGDGRPPRPAAATTASKKRRSTFVAPTRPTAPRLGVVLPRQDFNAWVDPAAVRPRQVPDAALAPRTFLPRQLFQAPPPGPRLPAPLSHEAHSAGRKAQTPSFSEPGRLPSHQVKKTSMEAAASDTRRTASTTSIEDDGDYLSSSSMPFSDWSPTPSPDYAMQINLAQKSYDETKGFPYIHCWMEVRHTEKFQAVYEAMKQAQAKRQSKPKESSKASSSQQEAHEDDHAPSKRPPGRKQSKQKQKMNEGSDDYALQFATFLQMKAEEHQKREERWKAEKELEERKLLWDQEQKIMFCDMSNMDESQRAYVMAMRQQITAAKVASVKASGGGSTSEQGSGGDAEEAESLM